MPRYRGGLLRCEDSRNNDVIDSSSSSESDSSTSSSSASTRSSNRSSISVGSLRTSFIGNNADNHSDDSSNSEGHVTVNRDFRNSSASDLDSDSEHDNAVNSDNESTSTRSENSISVGSVGSRQDLNNQSGVSGSGIGSDHDENSNSSIGSFLGSVASASNNSSHRESFGGSDEDLFGHQRLSGASPNSRERFPDLEDHSDRSLIGNVSPLGFFRRLFHSPSIPSEHNSEDSYCDAAATLNNPLRTMTGSTTSRTAASLSARKSSINFECSVCLESLDAPASINEGNNQEPQVVNSPQQPAAGSGSRRINTGRSQRKSSSRVERTDSQPTSLTTIVTTSCGHMYHKVCIEKWFTEQGRRTCPSCRKPVPTSKLIRLYPNISEDFTTQVANGPVAAGSSASTSGTSCSSSCKAPVTNSLLPRSGTPDVLNCDKQECQDLKDIHATLINDYNDMQQRFDNLRENDELKEAQIQSLEDDNLRKTNEIDNLKREVEELRSGSGSSSGAKRRRQ